MSTHLFFENYSSLNIFDASIKHKTITSYSDGSFGFDDLNVVSLFPGKVQDDNHLGSIFIFANYSKIVTAIGNLGGNNTNITSKIIYTYDGMVMQAVYNNSNKSYTIKPVTIAYPIEILYI